MKLAHVANLDPGLDLRTTIWNAFVNLLSLSDPDELSVVQRQAQLVFWYESEVQNGGYLQYFLNRGTVEAMDAIAALHILALLLNQAFYTLPPKSGLQQSEYNQPLYRNSWSIGGIIPGFIKCSLYQTILCFR